MQNAMSMESVALHQMHQCFAKCPFTCHFDQLSDQLCQSLDRLSDHFAKLGDAPSGALGLGGTRLLEGSALHHMQLLVL